MIENFLNESSWTLLNRKISPFTRIKESDDMIRLRYKKISNKIYQIYVYFGLNIVKKLNLINCGRMALYQNDSNKNILKLKKITDDTPGLKIVCSKSSKRNHFVKYTLYKNLNLHEGITFPVKYFIVDGNTVILDIADHTINS